MATETEVMEKLAAYPDGMTKEEIMTAVGSRKLPLAPLALDGKIKRKKATRTVKVEKEVTVYYATQPPTP